MLLGLPSSICWKKRRLYIENIGGGWGAYKNLMPYGAQELKKLESPGETGEIAILYFVFIKYLYCSHSVNHESTLDNNFGCMYILMNMVANLCCRLTDYASIVIEWNKPNVSALVNVLWRWIYVLVFWVVKMLAIQAVHSFQNLQDQLFLVIRCYWIHQYHLVFHITVMFIFLKGMVYLLKNLHLDAIIPFGVSQTSNAGLP
jgi:hypothetical protein